MSIVASRTSPGILAPFDVRFATTVAELTRINEVRTLVFRDEQGIVGTIDTAREDAISFNVYAQVDDRVVATGRLTPPSSTRPDAQLTWVATLPEFRRMGAASAIVNALVALADERRYPVVLTSAQTHAMQLYRKFGFTSYGTVFTVRGIEHQYMERRRQRSLG